MVLSSISLIALPMGAGISDGARFVFSSSLLLLLSLFDPASITRNAKLAHQLV